MLLRGAKAHSLLILKQHCVPLSKLMAAIHVPVSVSWLTGTLKWNVAIVNVLVTPVLVLDKRPCQLHSVLPPDLETQ